MPIIFVTAFGDEMHAARGYSLGAVDYILTPVVPEVLRTKVAVFVDLYQQDRAGAAAGRVAPPPRGAAAEARRRVGGDQRRAVDRQDAPDRHRHRPRRDRRHQAITLFVLEPAPRPAAAARRTRVRVVLRQVRRLARPAARSSTRSPTRVVARSRTATRMTEAELRDHPDWEIVRERARSRRSAAACSPRRSPAATATNLGVIYLCDRDEGEFTADDEAILVQLAQMASIAIENTLFAEEREANRIKDEFLVDAQPRAAHAAQRDPRLDAAAADGASPTTARSAHGLDVIERNAQAQTQADRGPARRVAHHHRQAAAERPADRRSAPSSRPRVDAVRPAAEAKGDRARCRRSTRRRARSSRRPRPAAAGRLEPAHQRRQVHARRRHASSVALRRDGERTLRSRVTDTRPGHRRRSSCRYVFDRFRQADSTSTRTHGGLGIGLTIVRHIVELHGGTVARRQRAARGRARRSPSRCRSPRRRSDRAAAPSRPRAATPRPGASRRDARRRRTSTGVQVLVVDDEPDAPRPARRSPPARRRRRRHRRLAPRRRWSCSRRDRAGRAGQRHRDARRGRLRADPRGPLACRRHAAAQTPAVALTAYARDEDRRRALAAGFQAHLAKPVEPTELLNVLSELASTAPGRTTTRLKLRYG